MFELYYRERLLLMCFPIYQLLSTALGDLAFLDSPRRLGMLLRPRDYRGNRVRNLVHSLYVFELDSRNLR
jgi:hypothetical protein